MSKKPDILWLSEPEDHDYPAAESYLNLIYDAETASNYVKAFKAECIKHQVAIGRQFPALPTHARVSFGTMTEMKKAFEVFTTTLA